MKKRIFSLLLALAMVLSLLPAGALAADGEDGAASAPALQTQSTTATVTVDSVDPASGDIEQSSGVNRKGPLLVSSNTDVTLSGQYYIVQNDVTINGDLTVDGAQIGGLVLCKGATLTVTGALIHTGGTGFFIYGQTEKNNKSSTGKLIIENNNNTGAAIRSAGKDAQLCISNGELELHGGDSGKLVDKVLLYSSQKMHMGILDGETVSPETWSQTSLNGSSLVLEYCDHPDAKYQPHGNTQHIKSCTQCGFNTGYSPTAADCGTDGYNRYVSVNNTGHRQECPCGNTFGDLIEHTIETVALDGTYHSSGCLHCDYIQGSREPHIYEDGVCKMCGFMPVASTDWEDYASVQEAMDALVKDKVQNGTIKLCPSTTDKIVYEEIVFNYPGQQITLNMNGYALVSGTGTPITVEAGTLIITGDAAIQNTGTNELAAPAILVEGGTLIFNGTVTATGGSGSSNAAPAIKVTGGKVVFHGKVTATGGLKGQSGNAMTCQPAIYAKGGQLEFNGDLDLNSGLTLTGSAELTNGLTQGTFKVDYPGKTVTGPRVSVEGSNVYTNLYSLLGSDRGELHPIC